MQQTKTRAQLVIAALAKLQVVAAGQTPEDEDKAAVDAYVDGLLLQLTADSICDVSSENAIPTEWVDPLASLLANMAASEFGKPYSLEVKNIFEQQLRRMTSSKPNYEVMQGHYF